MFLNSSREEMNQYNQRNSSKKCAVNSGLQEDDFEMMNGPEKGKIKRNGFVNGIAVDSSRSHTKNNKKKTKPNEKSTEPNQHNVNTFQESEVISAQDNGKPESKSLTNGKHKDSVSNTGTKSKNDHPEVDPTVEPVNHSENSKCDKIQLPSRGFDLIEEQCCTNNHEPERLAAAVEDIKLHDEVRISEEVKPIQYVQYESELQMPMIVKLIQKDLSEPYSIYTYRYFIHNWPKLCFLVRKSEHIKNLNPKIPLSHFRRCAKPGVSVP